VEMFGRSDRIGNQATLYARWIRIGWFPVNYGQELQRSLFNRKWCHYSPHLTEGFHRVVHMPKVILASQSVSRQRLLERSGLPFSAVPAKVDEETVTASLLSEETSPRDIADALAELKASRVAAKYPEALVLGSDQIIVQGGRLLSKPNDRDDAIGQLTALSGTAHQVWAAAVIFTGGRPVWRFVGSAKLHMRNLSHDYIVAYVDRFWKDIRYCAGCYRLEEEGVRLFSRIEGDFFSVLGMPLLEVQSYLNQRGDLEI